MEEMIKIITNKLIERTYKGYIKYINYIISMSQEIHQKFHR
jgi:hypothetical protein